MNIQKITDTNKFMNMQKITDKDKFILRLIKAN